MRRRKVSPPKGDPSCGMLYDIIQEVRKLGADKPLESNDVYESPSFRRLHPETTAQSVNSYFSTIVDRGIFERLKGVGLYRLRPEYR